MSDEKQIEKYFAQEKRSDSSTIDARELDRKLDRDIKQEGHTAKLKRLGQRLNLIKSVLKISLLILCAYFVIVVIDQWFFQRNIAEAASMVVLITIIGSVITTALGAVIGSSIN